MAKATSKTPAKTPAAKAASTPAANGKAPKPVPARRPSVVQPMQRVVSGPMMRKKELVDTVVSRTGLKKRDVKPAIEMALEVLGEALAENRELVLPPMGRLKVKRNKDIKGGRVLVAKVRQNDKTPEAQAERDTAAETE